MQNPDVEQANAMLAKIVEDLKALREFADAHFLNIEIYGIDNEPQLDGLAGNLHISMEAWLPSDMDC